MTGNVKQLSYWPVPEFSEKGDTVLLEHQKG